VSSNTSWEYRGGACGYIIDQQYEVSNFASRCDRDTAETWRSNWHFSLY